MKFGKLLIIVFFLGVLSYNAFAAKVYGNVYDLSLLKVSGSMITVNSTPQQQLISLDGTYSLEIQNGFYIMKAEKIESGLVVSADTKNITVNQKGEYIIDFILFPNFSEDELEVPDIIIPEVPERNLTSLLGLMFLLIMGIIFYYFFIKKRSEETEPDSDDLLNKVIGIIKNEDGRATQKEIRKQLPYSEAKISLVISELEHKGVVEKIKRGRGNVIVLKK